MLLNGFVQASKTGAASSFPLRLIPRMAPVPVSTLKYASSFEWSGLSFIVFRSPKCSFTYASDPSRPSLTVSFSSPVASSLFRLPADREPIGKRDGKSACKNHQLRDVHPCDQNTREYEAKYTEQHSGGETKRIRTRPLSAHYNESSGNGAVNEQPGSRRECCVPAKSPSGRKQKQEHRKGHNGQVRSAKPRMNSREKPGEIAPFTHRECKTRRVQHAGAHIAVNANQSTGADERYTKRSQEPARCVHGRLCACCCVGKCVNHDVLHGDIQ